MPRRTAARRSWSVVGGLLAAGALAVRGIMDVQAGSSGALLLVAGIVLLGVCLRQFVYRD